MALNPTTFLRKLSRLHTKRLIAIDPGTHYVKILLLEDSFGRLRILKQECLDRAEQGPLFQEEFHRHLETLGPETEPPPIALTLPQHLSLSQLIDLPAVGREQIRKLIEDETVKVSGVSEKAVVYDYSRLQPFGKYPNPYWLTLGPEGELLDQISRLALVNARLCEVTSTANALIAAYQAVRPGAQRAILIDFGATTTVVAVILDGQGVCAGTFPMGGDFLTDAIAAHRNCPRTEAENIKRTENLLADPEKLPGLQAAMECWQNEFARLLKEWSREFPELESSLPSFDMVLCGGSSGQPGLVDYLKQRLGLNFSLWPAGVGPAADWPSGQFVAAFGTALQALGANPQSASLLPAEWRATVRRQRFQQQIQSVNLIALLALVLTLILGTAHKLSLVNRKNALLVETQTALREAQATDASVSRLQQQYERFRPVLEHQKQTVDTLRTLSLLPQAGSNQNFWCVLFADQQSYFANAPPGQPPVPESATNRPAFTDVQIRTNPPPFKYGFIAELCLPEPGETARATLSQIVTNLKQAPLFRNVDTLAPARKKEWVDPKLVMPDHHFALTLDLVENEFQMPAIGKGKIQSPPASRDVKPAPRTFKQKAETRFPSKEY